MKLKQARFTDVLSHVDSRVDLGDTLTVFTGVSDSGKSGCMRGLLQVCRNEPAGIDLLRHGAKRGSCSEVEITGVDDAGTPFSIVRRRGKSKNEYEVDGRPLLAFGQEVPVEVRDLLRLSPHAFQIQSDGNFMLSATDGAVAKILSSTVGLAEIDAAFTEVRSRKVANDTALRCAEADFCRETEAAAAYDGMDASAAAVADFETVCAVLVETEDAVDEMIVATACLEQMRPDADSLCDAAAAALGVFVSADVAAAEAENVSDEMADAVTDYDEIPANASRQRIAAISAVNAAVASAVERDGAVAEISEIDASLTAAAALRPDATKAGIDAKALYGAAAAAAADLDMAVAVHSAMLAALAAAPVYGDAAAAVAATSREIKSFEETAEFLNVALRLLGEIITHETLISLSESECTASVKTVLDVKTEVENYKATHPVCPECGAEQRHWHTESK